MTQLSLAEKLTALRAKQAQVDAAWAKTGNRQLIEFFVDIIPKVVEAERCSIFILDPKEDNVWLQCGTHLKEKALKVPIWNSVVGRVIETGEIVVEYDMDNMVGVHDTVGLKTGFIVRDTLCVPVRGVSVTKTTGAIQILNKHGKSQQYTEEDKNILERLSYQLAMNIENIFLRQELGKVSVAMGKKIRELETRLQTGR